jgi:hypothetical protein
MGSLVVTTRPSTCTSVICFPRYRTTAKERDAESGNDYFGARYYASDFATLSWDHLLV